MLVKILRGSSPDELSRKVEDFLDENNVSISNIKLEAFSAVEGDLILQGSIYHTESKEKKKYTAILLDEPSAVKFETAINTISQAARDTETKIFMYNKSLFFGNSMKNYLFCIREV